MTERNRNRVEQELRHGEKAIAHLRGVSLDEAAQLLQVHAVLTGTSVLDVARDVLASRPAVVRRRSR
jgi:hypothetical protein